MKKRLTSLDAVRTFACLGVMAFHMHLCTFGHLGVSVFFVMSGFLSGYNHLESMDTGHITLGGSARFAYRKIIKLYPLYLIMLVIPAAGELYGVVNGMASLPTMLGKLAANVLLVQAWIPLNEYYFSYNGPAWYLSSAAFAYFMLPLVLRGVKRCRTRRAAALAIIAVWVGQAAIAYLVEGVYSARVADENRVRDFSTWFTYVFPVFRLGDFTVGCLIAKLFLMRRENAVSPLLATAAEAGAIALIVLAELSFENFWLNVNSTTLFLPASAALVYTFAVNEGYISKLLTCKLTAFISRISSDIYLIHAVVVMVCAPVCTALPVPFETQRAAYIVSIVAITLIASCMSGRVRTALAARRRAKTAAAA